MDSKAGSDFAGPFLPEICRTQPQPPLNLLESVSLMKQVGFLSPSAGLDVGFPYCPYCPLTPESWLYRVEMVKTGESVEIPETSGLTRVSR
jgi:hypothetical protein